MVRTEKASFAIFQALSGTPFYWVNNHAMWNRPTEPDRKSRTGPIFFQLIGNSSLDCTPISKQVTHVLHMNLLQARFPETVTTVFRAWLEKCLWFCSLVFDYFRLCVCHICYPPFPFPSTHVPLLISLVRKFYDVVCFAIKVRDVCSILRLALANANAIRSGGKWLRDGFCANFMSTFGGGGQSIVLPRESK